MLYCYSAIVYVHFIMSYGGLVHVCCHARRKYFLHNMLIFSRSCLLSVQFMSLFSFLRKEIICQSPDNFGKN